MIRSIGGESKNVLSKAHPLLESFQPTFIKASTRTPVWANIDNLWWPALVVERADTIKQYIIATKRNDSTLILVRTFPDHRYAWAAKIENWINNEWVHFKSSSGSLRNKLQNAIACAINFLEDKFKFPVDGTYEVERIDDIKVHPTTGEIYFHTKFTGWDQPKWISPSNIHKFKDTQRQILETQLTELQMKVKILEQGVQQQQLQIQIQQYWMSPMIQNQQEQIQAREIEQMQVILRTFQQQLDMFVKILKTEPSKELDALSLYHRICQNVHLQLELQDLSEQLLQLQQKVITTLKSYIESTNNITSTANHLNNNALLAGSNTSPYPQLQVGSLNLSFPLTTIYVNQLNNNNNVTQNPYTLAAPPPTSLPASTAMAVPLVSTSATVEKTTSTTLPLTTAVASRVGGVGVGGPSSSFITIPSPMVNLGGTTTTTTSLYPHK